MVCGKMSSDRALYQGTTSVVPVSPLFLSFLRDFSPRGICFPDFVSNLLSRDTGAAIRLNEKQNCHRNGIANSELCCLSSERIHGSEASSSARRRARRGGIMIAQGGAGPNSPVRWASWGSGTLGSLSNYTQSRFQPDDTSSARA